MTIMQARSREGMPQFLLWALVGAAGCLGLLGLLTIGVFVLPVALLAGGVLLWRTGMTRSVAGILSGAGVIPLYVSWLNRDGPGTVCTSFGDPGNLSNSGESCLDQWSPWPWLVAGLACIAAGVILFRLLPRLRKSVH